MKSVLRALSVLAFVVGLATPALAQYPTSNLGGTWYFRGLPAQIWQQGAQLSLQNEHGTYSRGAVVSSNTIIAYDWGNLYGRVTQYGQEIVWPDGATWTRYPGGGGGGQQEVRFTYGTCATWQGCTVYAYGTQLVFVNERGQRSNGYSTSYDRVYAQDWRLGGTLVYQGSYLTRIEWDNGSWWGR